MGQTAAGVRSDGPHDTRTRGLRSSVLSWLGRSTGPGRLAVTYLSNHIWHMNDTKNGPDRQLLFARATQQGGHFTTAQARECGYSRSLLSHHAGTGEFIRIHRGVYRFRDYPSHPRGEVIAAWLAAGPDRAAVSHESALELLDLSDVVPSSIHITVPRARRGFAPPPGVTLHTTTRPFGQGQVTVRDGMRVTAPARSIVDAAEAGIAPEQVRRAVTEAIARGLTNRRHLLAMARSRGSRVQKLVEHGVSRVGRS